MASVNTFTTQQAATLMNEVYKEATGNKSIDTLPSGDFVTVAQAALKTGVDPVIGAISKVLARTLFSIRPYDAKFKGIEVDEQKYGAITRKIYPIDDPAFETDERLLTGLNDGDAVDMYKLHKPKVLQLNFYGEAVFQKHITIFKDQLDLAFKSAEEFGRFLAMVMQAASNEIEQAIENAARMTIANYVAGVYTSDISLSESTGSGNRVVQLITAYNTFFNYSAGDPDATPPVAADAGYIDSYATAIKTPEFWKWAYAYLGKKIEMMENRTELFHTTLTGKPISKQTSRDQMNIWVLSDVHRYFDTMAKAGTYHDDYLSVDGVEDVAYWQAAQSPMEIKNKPTFLRADGTLNQFGPSDDPVNLTTLAMVVADKEALGITRVNQWEASTPFNAAGGYTNLFWHWTIRFWNDFVENGMIVLMQ